MRGRGAGTSGERRKGKRGGGRERKRGREEESERERERERKNKLHQHKVEKHGQIKNPPMEMIVGSWGQPGTMGRGKEGGEKASWLENEQEFEISGLESSVPLG